MSEHTVEPVSFEVVTDGGARASIYRSPGGEDVVWMVNAGVGDRLQRGGWAVASPGMSLDEAKAWALNACARLNEAWALYQQADGMVRRLEHELNGEVASYG